MIKDYIYDKQETLFGPKEIIGFGTKDWHIKEIDRKIANKLIIKNHYSHKFYNLSYIHLGIFDKGILVGCLQYGYAMNPASQANIVKNTKIDEYLELNRLWISDKCPKNSESKSISYSIKYIKRKFPKIKWIQSFADERCKCFGIVYQACSFKYYGEHTSTFWELDGKFYHNIIKTSQRKGSKGFKLLNSPENKNRCNNLELRQFRYLFFIKKSAEKDCLLTQQPYPKYYNE